MKGSGQNFGFKKSHQKRRFIPSALGALIFISCAGQEHKSQISRRSPDLDLSQQDAAKQLNQRGTGEEQASPSKDGVGTSESGDSKFEGSTPLPDSKGQKMSKSKQETPQEAFIPIQYDGFFFPAKMKECHDAGKIYDRATLTCHPTQLLGTSQNGFTCNKTGIIKAFENSTGLETNVDSKVSAGWKIDQCAYDGSKKIVYFVCFTTQSEICTSSPRCQDPQNLEPKNTKFCVSKISES